MKNGFLVFLASLIALGGSWCGFVLAPVLQLGGEKQTAILNTTDLYPVDRPGMANQGLQVYRANGCAACHTEQVQQSGVACDVVLTSAGKNPAAMTNLISSLKLNGLDKDLADALVEQITAAGGKAEIHIVATGPDIARGWGRRHSVAEDFLYDDPVQLGSLRIGPDLAGRGHAPAGCQLAIGSPVRAAKRGEGFGHAAVPLSFPGPKNRQRTFAGRPGFPERFRAAGRL